MPLADLLFTMLNRRGITLNLELRNYMKIAHPGMDVNNGDLVPSARSNCTTLPEQAYHSAG